MDHLKHKVRKYFTVMWTSFQSNLAYTVEIIYRSLFMLMVLYIFIQLWKIGYGNNYRINGMTYNQVIWYLLMSETIMLSKVSIASVIAEEVKSGTIAYAISRPYNYLWYHFFNGMGSNLLNLIINFICGSILITLLVGPMPVTPLVLIPVAFIMLLSLLLDFCIGALIGLYAFSIEDVSGYALIYQKILFVFGGLVIPLDFFPKWLRELSLALPFKSILYLPAKLFINFTPQFFLEGVLQQSGWCLLLLIILGLIYYLNIKKLCINGG